MMIFLEAARLVVDAGHDVEFVIASQGSQQIVLRHRAQRLQIADRVTVADYPNVSAEFWSVLDIYCQPAVVASTGRTLIQAFGHAIPCIATDVKGLPRPDRSRRKWLDRSRGPIPAPLRERSLLFSMIPVAARRLGSVALDRARAHFDPEVEADRLVDLYHQAAFVDQV